ncbi:Eukaryotic DNA topoisomerase I, catalytic core [compost metagenome]
MNRRGLRYVSDCMPGIRRVRSGKGFRYIDSSGKAVRDSQQLCRIRKLAIPPAYTDVWICALAEGHLQATGRDVKGRKQYRYHADWVSGRSDDKFAHIVEFGKALPALRRRVRRDLSLPGMPRDKVLALVAAVMGRTLARVGNGSYARSNHSYGLTTLRNRHVGQGGDGELELSFMGKSGKVLCYAVNDPRLARLVRRCRDLPGQMLFQYRDGKGNVCPVSSEDINRYLREAMGGEFSAKDFRTWGGTLHALIELSHAGIPEGASQRSVAASEKRVVETVAAALGNTPAVCRRAYIDPCVFDAWRRGALEPFRTLRGTRQWEAAALRILRAGHARNG